MKKLLYILAGLATLGVTSCDEFLEKKPLARMGVEEAFASKEYVVKGVNGIYDPLGYEKTYSVSYWVFGDGVSDDAEIGGHAADQPKTQDLQLFKADAYNTRLYQFYAFEYIGIQRANTLLDLTEKNKAEIDYSEEEYKQYRGQAYFLRALYYFDLLKVFGPVPYSKKNLSSVEALSATNRVPAEKGGDDALGSKHLNIMFEGIISDLKKASASLPVKWDATEAGRATKGSAQGLLAKVYAFYASYQQNDVYKLGINPQTMWENCITYADSVINEPAYDLVDDYHKLFSYEGENSSESLFEIQFIPGTLDGTQYEGTIRSVYQTARQLKGKTSSSTASPGYGWNQPRQDYVDIFETLNVDGKKVDWDPRLDMIAKPGDSVMWDCGAGLEWAVYDVNSGGTSGSGTGYWSRKAEIPYELRGPKDQSEGLNYTLLRYADVLLLKAEALAELNREPETVLDLVNQVRERARNSHADEAEGKLPADLDAADLDDVREERRRELGMEGHRFFDIVRWGIADDIFKNILTDAHKRSVNWKSGVTVRMPIPNRAINEGDGSLKQNYGY